MSRITSPQAILSSLSPSSCEDRHYITGTAINSLFEDVPDVPERVDSSPTPPSEGLRVDATLSPSAPPHQRGDPKKSGGEDERGEETAMVYLGTYSSSSCVVSSGAITAIPTSRATPPLSSEPMSTTSASSHSQLFSCGHVALHTTSNRAISSAKRNNHPSHLVLVSGEGLPEAVEQKGILCHRHENHNTTNGGAGNAHHTPSPRPHSVRVRSSISSSSSTSLKVASRSKNSPVQLHKRRQCLSSSFSIPMFPTSAASTTAATSTSTPAAQLRTPNSAEPYPPSAASTPFWFSTFPPIPANKSQPQSPTKRTESKSSTVHPSNTSCTSVSKHTNNGSLYNVNSPFPLYFSFSSFSSFPRTDLSQKKDKKEKKKLKKKKRKRRRKTTQSRKTNDRTEEEKQGEIKKEIKRKKKKNKKKKRLFRI